MDACGSALLVLLAAFLVVAPSADARKCYVCDSNSNPGCQDANQISQLYTDCSSGGGQYGGSFSGSQFGGVGGGIGQPGLGQTPFGGQGGFGQPQQMGQQGFGGVGGGYGGDRCTKVTIVGGGIGGPNGQPRVIRQCGSAGTDGCFWQGATHICSCNWNYCNGSSRLSTASISAILFAVCASVLSHFYRSSL